MARRKVIALTPEDVEFIRELAQEVYSQARPSGGRSRSLEDDDYPAPECYVAKTPSGGITAFATETGTGSGVGGDTGTGYDEAFMPSSGTCAVYKLVTVEPRGTKELVATGFSKLVYNLLPVSVAGSVFVVIVRDKYGNWYIPNPGLGFTTC